MNKKQTTPNMLKKKHDRSIKASAKKEEAITQEMEVKVKKTTEDKVSQSSPQNEIISSDHKEPVLKERVTQPEGPKKEQESGHSFFPLFWKKKS